MDPERANAVLRSRTSLFGLLGVLSVLPALIAPTILDAPHASRDPAKLLLFASLFTFPLVCFGSVLVAWPLHRRQHYTAAVWVSSLPMGNLALGIAAWCWRSLAAGR